MLQNKITQENFEKTKKIEKEEKQKKDIKQEKQKKNIDSVDQFDPIILMEKEEKQKKKIKQEKQKKNISFEQFDPVIRADSDDQPCTAVDVAAAQVEFDEHRLHWDGSFWNRSVSWGGLSDIEVEEARQCLTSSDGEFNDYQSLNAMVLPVVGLECPIHNKMCVSMHCCSQLVLNAVLNGLPNYLMKFRDLVYYTWHVKRARIMGQVEISLMQRENGDIDNRETIPLEAIAFYAERYEESVREAFEKEELEVLTAYENAGVYVPALGASKDMLSVLSGSIDYLRSVCTIDGFDELVVLFQGAICASVPLADRGEAILALVRAVFKIHANTDEIGGAAHLKKNFLTYQKEFKGKHKQSMTKSISRSLMGGIKSLLAKRPENQGFLNGLVSSLGPTTGVPFGEALNTLSVQMGNFSSSITGLGETADNFLNLIFVAMFMIVVFKFVGSTAESGWLDLISAVIKTILVAVPAVIVAPNISRFLTWCLSLRNPENQGDVFSMKPFYGLCVALSAIASGVKDVSVNSLESVLKKVESFKKRCDGLEHVGQWIVDCIETCVNLVRVNVMGLCPISFATVKDQEAAKWLDRAMEILNLARDDKFPVTLENSEVLSNVIKCGKQIQARLAKMSGHDSNSGFAQLSKFLQYLEEVEGPFNRACCTMSGLRVRPTIVLITGAPGNGKTQVAMPMIASLGPQVLPSASVPEFTRDMMHFVYVRNAECGYWDGYAPHKLFMVIDDFMQARDVAGNADNEIMDIIRCGSAFPNMLHMADLSQKGNTMFRSQIILATSNLMDFKPNSISQPEALNRRFDFIAHTVPKAEFCTLETKDLGLELRRLDPSKVAGPCDTGIYEFHLMKYFAGQLLPDKVVDYDTLVAMVAAMAKSRQKELAEYCEAIRQKIVSATPPDIEGVDLFNAENQWIWPKWLFGDAQERDKQHKDSVTRTILACQYAMNRDGTDMYPCTMAQLESYLYSLEPLTLTTMRAVLVGESSTSRMYLDSLKEKILAHPGTSNLVRLKFKNALLVCESKYQTLKDWFSCHPTLVRVAAFSALFLGASAVAVWMMRKSGASSEPAPSRVAVKPVDKNDAWYAELGRNAIAHEAFDIMPVAGNINFGDFDDDETMAKLGRWCMKVGLYDEKLNWTEKVDGVWIDQIKNKRVWEGLTIVVKPESNQPPVHARAKTKPPAAWGKKPNPSYEAGWVNSVIDQASTVFRKNVAFMMGTSADQAVGGTITFLCDRYFVMNTHYVSMFKALQDKHPGEELVFEAYNIYRNATISIPLACVLGREVTKTDIERDWMVFKGPSTMQPFPNIISRFVSRSSPILSGYDIELMFLSGDGRTVRNSHGLGYVTSTAVGNDDPYILKNAMQYDVPTKPGDCGSWVVYHGPKSRQLVIFGVHSAGTNMGANFGTLVFKEDLLDEVRKLGLDAAAEDLPVISQSAPIQVTPGGDIGLEGSFKTICTVKPPQRSSCKTNIVKTPLFGLWGPTWRRPALLGDKTVDGVSLTPLKWALERYGSGCVEIPIVEMRSAANDVFKDMQRTSLVQQEKRILTYDEAIMGVEGDDAIKSLPRKTSCGFPFCLFPVPNYPGKTRFFGKTDDFDLSTVAAKELKERVEYIIDQARRNVRCLHVYTDNLKDELRPIEKVKKGKTRLFSGSPIDYMLCVRQYFATFVAWIVHNRVINGIAVGINVYDEDWGRIVHYLSQVGSNFIAGDFSAFDASLSADLLGVVGELIQAWYSDEHGTTRLVLWQEVVNSRHVSGDVIYEWSHGLPSGHPLTTIINCLANRILFYAAFAKLCPGLEFSDHVRLVVYGDDNVLSVSDDVVGVFNQHTLTEYFRCVGMTYTGEDKEAELVPKFRSLSDVSFLKRKFVQNERFPGKWVAPLELRVVLDMAYWTINSIMRDKISTDKTETALNELSLHGKKVFLHWAAKIYNHAHLVGVPKPLDLTADWLSRYGRTNQVVCSEDY